LNRPEQVAVGRTLQAAVFLAALYPLIKAFGLPGAGWAGVIAYAFTCGNRLIALNRILPGILSKLLKISLSSLAAAGLGVLIASIVLTFLASPLPRVIFGGSVSIIFPAVIMLLARADLRKWVVQWFFTDEK
jgi:hypothetical protein